MGERTSHIGHPASGTPERDLIERALRQVSPEAPTSAPASSRRGSDLPPPGTFEGYEVVREIHRGGQGVVYLAIQLATKRKVAIKVMHVGPFGGSSGRSRFEREVQVLGQLNHPHIVGIHDSGVTERGDFYYVMDYISGRSLEEVLKETRAAPVADTLQFFVKICDAVNAAHLRGIIHRDLKPSNVRIDRDGEPVVVDFGLAKIAVPDLTDDETPQLMSMTGQFIGSLPWASPEQAEGSPGAIDVRTDVYSLGVMLYQLLTGRFPYEVRGNMRDVLDNILRTEPARPSTVRRGINNEVETIVLKCLAKDRERRYQSAGELARDIRHYLAGEPIEAKRDSGWYVISKTMTRYKGRVGVAVAFLLVIIAFSIGMTVLYRGASAARDEARFHRDQLLEGVWGMAFEVSDEIERVLGATAARESVLALLNESLPELQARASGDAAFMRKIADLHDRHGELLSRMYAANLGQPTEARKAHERARDLRRPLLAASPDDARLHASAARNHVGMARLIQQMDRDFGAARAEAQAAADSLTRAVSLAGGDAALLRELEIELNEARLMVADYALLESGETDASAIEAAYADVLGFWSDRLLVSPGDATARRQVARIENKTSQKLCDAATTLYNRLDGLTDQGEVIAAIDKSEALLTRAEVLSRRALGTLEALLGTDPQNGELSRDVNLARHHLGQATFMRAMLVKRRPGLDETERRERAGALLRSALAQFDAAVRHAASLASSDLKNAEASRDLVLYLNKRGNTHRELGEMDPAGEHLALARADFAESERVRAGLAAGDPTRLRQRELAVARYKLGQLMDLLARRTTDPAERSKRFDEALQWFDLAHRGFSALQREGVGGMEPIIAQVEKEREASREAAGAAPPP